MPLDSTQLRVDFRSKQPIFEQIADTIREEIRTGRLQFEDQLPTVRQVADYLKINFNTVARAYRALDFEGLISTQRGRGTFVIPIRLDPPEEPAPSAQYDAQAEDIHIEEFGSQDTFHPGTSPLDEVDENSSGEMLLFTEFLRQLKKSGIPLEQFISTLQVHFNAPQDQKNSIKRFSRVRKHNRYLRW